MHCRIWCSALFVMAVVVWSWDASCVHCESNSKFHTFMVRSQNSSCLSVRMEQRGSEWTDFHEILYVRIFRKNSVEKI